MPDKTPGNPFSSLPDRAHSGMSSNNAQEEQPVGLLGDKYLIMKVHRGGMGEVYICNVHSEEERQYALKTFQKRFFFDHATREAFAREVSLWARLSGLPHIMPIVGLERISGQLFALMPVVLPGPIGETTVRDLLNLVDQLGPLSLEATLSLAFQMALGLRSAQERVPGIVHGDLKPENLLLVGGIRGSLLISDFGLARVATALGQESQLESTWAYRAPECWVTPDLVSPFSDMYSFGVVLYELLAGQTPFQAATRENWSKIHREEQPSPPINFSQESTGAKLMSLALQCLQKRPEDRPQTFGDVLTKLFHIAQEHDYLLSFELVHSAYHQKNTFEEIQKNFRSVLIKNLVKLDMYDLALTEIETIPPELFDGDLWRLRGNLLSLKRKDAEALLAFERALQFDLAEEERHWCLSEYALSLKHLNRFQEAIEIYKQLLVQVPKNMLEVVICNLTTVYIKSKRPEEAVHYLQGVTREHPDFPEVWGNLGLAYEQLGQYKEAARCYQYTLAIDPDRAEIRMMLAKVYMDYLGQIEEATTTLELVWGQGHASREWFVRLMTCYGLLGQNERMAQLASGLTKSEILEVTVEVQKLAKRIQITSSSQKSKSVSKRKRFALPFHSYAKRAKSLLESLTHREKKNQTGIDLHAKPGKELIDPTRCIHVLLIQSKDNNHQLETIEEICRHAGFNSVPQRSPVALLLLDEGIQRGVLEWGWLYSVWQKSSNVAHSIYADETPPEVEQVVRLIQRSGKAIQTLSTTYEATEIGQLEDQEEEEAYFRQELQVNPGDFSCLYGLIQILIFRGKLEEAREKALAATRLYPDNDRVWQSLGLIEMRNGHFKEAIEAFEASRAINPLDRPAVFFLARCYRELGHLDKAEALAVLGQSLGGPLL